MIYIVKPDISTERETTSICALHSGFHEVPHEISIKNNHNIAGFYDVWCRNNRLRRPAHSGLAKSRIGFVLRRSKPPAASRVDAFRPHRSDVTAGPRPERKSWIARNHAKCAAHGRFAGCQPPEPVRSRLRAAATHGVASVMRCGRHFSINYDSNNHEPLSNRDANSFHSLNYWALRNNIPRRADCMVHV
ncbi:hypothetical protein [Burkholderia plantarii]|uniref:hypothetical protein n=1 Tax=Burkholderia plantarii TaxID=41899 RepID=UPI000F4D61F5|nr:hypothetical protein [Burkholderia plantarii]